MKCILALVVLSHICCGTMVNSNLNSEIIRSLQQLNKLYNESKLNITSPETLQAPGIHMWRKPKDCVGVFVRELKKLLDRVTVPGHTGLIEALEKNLDLLGRDQKINTSCTMTPVTDLSVFSKYIHFMRKLNNSKRR